MNKVQIKPFLKWAGGKIRVIEQLKNFFPANAKRYIEPFLGAGSVALNVNYPRHIVNDINSDLFYVWQMLKDNGMDFVKECEGLFKPENNTEEYYYELRDEFNKTKDILRKATLFIYLNKHCYNGLCRYNSKGGFNTPKGSYKVVNFPQEEFEKSLEQVKKFEIHNKDFREIFEMVGEGDLVYCDPPYVPLSMSANFDAYADGGFGLQDHINLAECAYKVSQKGATVIISNHYNWVSKQIYVNMFGGKISKIKVSRTISCDSEKREPVEEVIAVFEK